MYASKQKTNDLWRINLNTENPIAPHQLKDRQLEQKIFSENFENRNDFGTMDLFHKESASSGTRPIHEIGSMKGFQN
jgi:hypothetical protein